jgi:hypothetical protein
VGETAERALALNSRDRQETITMAPTHNRPRRILVHEMKMGATDGE